MVTEGSWGPSTQWHHMQCTIFQVKTAEEVEGFEDLDDAIQASMCGAPPSSPTTNTITITATEGGCSYSGFAEAAFVN